VGGHPIDVRVGEKLRSFRLQRKLSQTQIAETVGLTFQQIQKYEKGVNRVSASKLFEFAELLDVSVESFFSDVSDRPAGGGLRPLPAPSHLDYEILELLGHLEDGRVKRGIRNMLQALVPGEPPIPAIRV
jgi:transcriptional regulator with XRE-family HTH domain